MCGLSWDDEIDVQFTLPSIVEPTTCSDSSNDFIWHYGIYSDYSNTDAELVKVSVKSGVVHIETMPNPTNANALHLFTLKTVLPDRTYSES